MSIELAQFYQTFFEESFEGLDGMESALLNLRPGAADSETINTIFRAAHSIKGGAATFGFADVASFTHVLETLLDEMRSGTRMVTKLSQDLLLQSGDCVREMLTSVQVGSPLDQARVQAVQAKLTALQQSGDGKGSSANEPVGVIVASPTQASSAPSSPATEQSVESTGWRIQFKPHEHLFRTGNDPVRIFRELALLGEIDVAADLERLPGMADLDPETCYLSWILVLHNAVPKSQIEAVFEWVQDDCDLAIQPLAPVGVVAPVAPSVQVPVRAQAAAKVEFVPPVSAEPLSQAQGVPATVAQVPEQEAPSNAVAPILGIKKTGSSPDQGSIRVSTEKIDALINMVGELVITQSMLGQLGADIDMSRLEKLRDGLAQLERNTRELQETVMRIRMLPIGSAFQRLPRMVRDLSQKLGKDVELQLVGEQTELDKTVLEKIGDPLVHLVRNAIDHGIELPAVREANGKSRGGTIRLNAFHQGGNVVIEISDDGSGIDKDRVIAKARSQGLVKPDELLSDDAMVDLIFAPGFSTAEKVSDVSGRGVGMDVVRRNIKELGGTVEIKTTPKKGSTFVIRLPLTLAILDGQLIKVGEHTYIVPLVSIFESLQVKRERVNAIAGQAELYKLRDDYIPVVRLNEAFGIESRATALTDGLLVVVEGDGQRAGLFIDDLLGQQQVVIKSLETNFRRVEGVSGATILGDGTVALILDVGGLIKLAREGRRGSGGQSRRRAQSGSQNRAA